MPNELIVEFVVGGLILLGWILLLTVSIYFALKRNTPCRKG
jgi:hypothetical protein